MSVTARTHAAGYLIYTLTAGDDEVVVSAFGGQILSWTRHGIPIIFENREHAIVDGKTAYRGGSPICFPYFGKGTLLPLGTTLNPQHGYARVSVWDSSVLEDENAVRFSTVQPTTEGYGPSELLCELVYALGEGLTMQATIRNMGENDTPFQFVAHSYWATTDPAEAVAKGLGNRFLDNLCGYSEREEVDSSKPHMAPVDRVYPGASDRLIVQTGAYELEIATQGCSGAVLWNPGKEHSLKDLGSPDFICVESGVLYPAVVLAPEKTHVINIRYLAQVR